MNQEHPTGTERKSLNYECGWKGGDIGGLAERKKGKNHGKSKKLLTGIGLLMEGPIRRNCEAAAGKVLGRFVEFRFGRSTI
jgi:hypothetical protein